MPYALARLYERSKIAIYQVLTFMLVSCTIASVHYKSLINWETIVIQAHVIRGRQHSEFFQESVMAILSQKLPI